MATTHELQSWRARCVREAAICDREVYAAREAGDWVAETFATDFAAMYRREAIAASMALRVADRVQHMARAA